MDRQNNRDWLLLVHQLPPKPTNLRVRIWRKLQRLGAVAIKNSVYVLPYGEKTNEDFQWLKQEIETTGGEASVFRAGAIEGATQREIIAAFTAARNQEYSQLAGQFDSLNRTIRQDKNRRAISAARIKAREAELGKLHKELERITAIDFFAAKNKTVATAAYERCQRAIHDVSSPVKRPRGKPVDSGFLDPAQFQNRRWVTRKNLFADRLATMWFIKRFIDHSPRFAFVSEGEPIEGAIAFDMYGAQFTHEGDSCTLETMIKRFGLRDDKGLREIAEIIHDIDLKDNKYDRLEASGLAAVIRGLADSLKDDRKLAAQCSPIFDGLYGLLGNKNAKTKRSKKQKRR